MALTPKQRAFVGHYCSNGFNGTQAAISAGYSEKTAQAIASENLTKPIIEEEIDRFMNSISEKAEITALDLVAELEEARDIAKKVGQSSTLVAATMGKAKLLGLDKTIVEMESKTKVTIIDLTGSDD